MEKNKLKKSIKWWVIFCLLFFFDSNFIKFITIDDSELALLSSLFKMITSLPFLRFLIHRNMQNLL